MKQKSVLLILLIMAGVILSKAWFKLPTKSEVLDFTRDKFTRNVKTTENLVKQYNRNIPQNRVTLEIPSKEEPIEKPVNVSDASSFYSLYYGDVGTSLSQSKNEFDGTYGKEILEIAKNKSLGFYKVRYLYEETKEHISKGLELSYAACSGDINVDLFKLNECNIILQGTRLEPYIQTKMNETLKEFRAIAQVNGISAIDTNKITSQDYEVGEVKYTITTIGNIITITAIYNYNK